MFAVFGKTRATDGIWKTAEAETLEHAVITWEEM